MKVIDVTFDRPYDNFALEEYLLTKAPEDEYFFFYIHRPSIIVGRHQNTLEEINEAYVQEHGITVARRMSGGGAVYHDHGNLNFSFVKPGRHTDVNDFASFTKPIVGALQSLGVPVQLSGRNDLTIDGKKISGNASCFKNGRILSHGTILFKADVQALGKALSPNEIKLRSKGVQSVQARVANLADYLQQDMSIEGLKKAILHYFSQQGDMELISLDPVLVEKIHHRAETHFAQWEWNWGQSPDYNQRCFEKFSCGIIDIRLKVVDGIIKRMKIYGDFFTAEDVARLENIFENVPYDEKAVERVLIDISLDDYFKEMDQKTFLAFLFHKEFD